MSLQTHGFETWLLEVGLLGLWTGALEPFSNLASQQHEWSSKRSEKWWANGLISTTGHVKQTKAKVPKANDINKASKNSSKLNTKSKSLLLTIYSITSKDLHLSLTQFD